MGPACGASVHTSVAQEVLLCQVQTVVAERCCLVCARQGWTRLALQASLLVTLLSVHLALTEAKDFP